MRHLSLACTLGALLLLSSCRIFDFGPTPDPFYDAVLEARPDHTGALFLQGQRMIDQGNFQDAEAYFKRLTRAAPGQAMGWIGLGQARLEDRRASAAERAFRQAMALEGETLAQAHIGLISSLLLQGQTEAADAELGRYEQREGVSAATMRLRGDLAFLLNQFAEAVEHYQASLGEDPQQPAIRERLADLQRFLARRG